MMSRAALATLASEIEQSRPTPEWDSISELKRFRQEVSMKDGSKKKFTFDQLVVRYKEISAEIDFREKLKAEVKEAVEAAILLSGEEKVLAEGYRVSLVHKAGSKKISAEKLLSAGVSAMTIAAATEQGRESTYVDIRKAKE